MRLPSLASFWLKRPIAIERGPLFEDVRAAIEDVQTYARSHGGEIALRGVNAEGDVFVAFSGTCKGCPLSEITLRLTVEKHLRESVPGIRKVKRVNR